MKDSAGTVVLRGNFVEVPEDDDDVERKAELIGAAGATGEAEIEVSKTNNQLEQEVEVSVSKLTPGHDTPSLLTAGSSAYFKRTKAETARSSSTPRK